MAASARAPLVSLVVLTRDRCRQVHSCLASLVEQDYSSCEIVLVDNGSSDDTVASVRAAFPSVRLVACGSNLGVAGGRNRGIAEARGEICILVDDDARLAGRGVAAGVVCLLEQEPRVACVAFRVVDGRSGCEDARTIPRADKRPALTRTPAAYFCGAGFAVRRQAFEDLGGFWEPLVYAGEELDFSYRLLERGGEILFDPSLVVLHDEAEGPARRGQWVYHQARNRCWVAARNLPWRFVLSTTLLWWVATARVAIARGEAAFWLAGIRDAVRGLPAALRGRRRVGRPVLAEIARRSGRLWY